MCAMTKEELNSYRLTSLEEPTDEMLAAIMHEAAEEVRKESERIDKWQMEQIREEARKAKQRWGVE